MAFIPGAPTFTIPTISAAMNRPSKPRPSITVLPARGRTRVNENPDALFYATPRYLPCVDDAYSAMLESLYEQVITGRRVFDLGASCNSHYRKTSHRTFVEGLGMNADEMNCNPVLNSYLVRDLNAAPFETLPVWTMYFDAVICNATVPYLTQPEMVFREMRRILRIGGVLVVSFTDSFLRDKAIAAWRESAPLERVQLVKDLIVKSTNGNFKVTRVVADEQLSTHRNMQALSPQLGNTAHVTDPFYAVVAKRIA